MVISRENLHDEARVRSRLAEKLGASVRLIDGIGAVSAIGAGINTSYHNLRAGSAALASLQSAGRLHIILPNHLANTSRLGRHRCAGLASGIHRGDAAPCPVGDGEKFQVSQEPSSK